MNPIQEKIEKLMREVQELDDAPKKARNKVLARLEEAALWSKEMYPYKKHWDVSQPVSEALRWDPTGEKPPEITLD